MYRIIFFLLVLPPVIIGCAVHRIYIQTKPDTEYYTRFQYERNLGFKENVILSSGDSVAVFEVWNLNPGRFEVYRVSDSSIVGYIYLDPHDYPNTDMKKLKHGWQGPSNVQRSSLITASPSLLTVRLQRFKGTATSYLVFENDESSKSAKPNIGADSWDRVD